MAHRPSSILLNSVEESISDLDYSGLVEEEEEREEALQNIQENIFVIF